jgi:hypothetical protein
MDEINATKEKDLGMEKRIEACSDCFKSCARTFKHCLDMGGPHALPKHLNLLKDCMEICKVTEDFLLRDSTHLECVSEECAKICEQCAASCDETDPNDGEMKECAKACRQCAETVRPRLYM